MTSTDTTTTEAPVTGERADLLEALNQVRFFLRHTAQNLTEDQANTRSTVSELTIAKLLKHVAQVEETWVDFILEGPKPVSEDPAEWVEHWLVKEEETLAVLLARYEEVAARTDRVITELPSLDITHKLPEAPWFEPGKSWSARRVVAHLIAEIAQHTGHADIIRESIDGQKSMG
ncbi:putative damage-inducible protein DinB [Crossiella equi]|uniref:Damage-inducible protein DinB n=1 Tax=Crossiella equi TaxID=130796 RepID=A0ABS5AF73_9PSEU|nr:DinB family protein [Crossiella equi]MBP2475231.1 putative damage-inducible protein DinB [Crossiella equi]